MTTKETNNGTENTIGIRISMFCHSICFSLFLILIILLLFRFSSSSENHFYYFCRELKRPLNVFHRCCGNQSFEGNLRRKMDVAGGAEKKNPADFEIFLKKKKLFHAKHKISVGSTPGIKNRLGRWAAGAGGGAESITELTEKKKKFFFFNENG